MSARFDVLLIDAGNTNVKYCLASVDGELQMLRGEPVSIAALLTTHNIRKVLLASVRGADFSQQVAQYCAALQVAFEQIHTSAEAFGTRCGYADFQTLGVDRWMSVLAAAQHNDDATLSISVGTAMTVDLIVNRQHIGGWIIPGFDLSKKALFGNTDGVFGDQSYPVSDEFGKSTPDCVNFGCRALINGLVREAVFEARKTTKVVSVVICGGGQRLVSIEALKCSLHCDIQFDELRIFRGLARFI